VARIDPNKDLETLLRAVNIVRSYHIPIHLRIRGSVSVPSYHEKVLALWHELQLEDVVEFAGHASDISEDYRQADIAVQSSVTEAFPYSVLEAMMSGLAMVATDVGGTREALANTGILVPSRDPEQLALAIAMLAQDPDLRAKLGVSARERALKYFEISTTLKAFLRLYQNWQAGRRIESAAPATQDAVLIHVTRGLVLSRLNQLEMALEELNQALSLVTNYPASVPLLIEMANIELRRGHREAAYQRLIQSWVIANGLGHPPSRAS
jgi:tetratricopeptide (TPR) repeat protein